MFLTKISLNNMYAFRDVLHDGRQLHRFTMSWFPQLEDNTNPRSQFKLLWRLDTVNNLPSILMLSSVEPSFDRVREDYVSNLRAEWKNVSDLYASVLALPEISLRVRIMPVRRNGSQERTIQSVDEIIEVFSARLREHGLDPIEGKIDYMKAPYMKMPGERRSSPAGDLILRARVTDPVKALALTQDGFGRGKNYGYGLIQVGR